MSQTTKMILDHLNDILRSRNNIDMMLKSYFQRTQDKHL